MKEMCNPILHKIVINPFSQNDLVCLSNGLLATEVVKSDMLGALDK